MAKGLLRQYSEDTMAAFRCTRALSVAQIYVTDLETALLGGRVKLRRHGGGPAALSTCSPVPWALKTPSPLPPQRYIL